VSKGLPLPAQEELHRCFRYERETGLLYWRERAECLANWNARYPGTVAGTKGARGYVHVLLRRRFLAVHRVIWLMVHGVEPAGEIDHRDGDRTNNRVENLRDATPSQNHMNMAARGEWPKGVYLYRKDGLFRAQIKFRGKTKYLGSYSTPEAAHEAYRQAATEHFGAFACFDR